jgi:hypothetical protein
VFWDSRIGVGSHIPKPTDNVERGGEFSAIQRIRKIRTWQKGHEAKFGGTLGLLVVTGGFTL